MINIIADSIDRLEDDVDFFEYFKSGQGLEHILFNLTDEDLERPELKEAIKKVFSIIPGAQSMEKKLGTRTLLKGIIKKFPEDPRVIDFIKVAAEIDLSYINEKIDNVSELKRVISSDKNPEEFINWLANEATALGIYWSFGDGFAYDADKSHPYRYTFVTNVSKDDVDVKRTQLASLKFHRNEQEIRLKQGTAIKLTQVLYDGSPLQLPPEVLEKTFYTSESDIEGSKMLHIEKLASSEDLELSRGEIGVSLEDYDPSKDKEKSTKNRWREKPNQNTAVKPALTQESDNYKKDKLDKAKYTNFLGRTDQDKPVRVMDFATPGQYVGLDDYFTKHTDTLQDDQQQYDTRNFGRGKMQPKQYSNFLYKSELLHITTLSKIAAEPQDNSGTTSIIPTVTDKVTESVTQKPVTPVTQGKGGKPTKGSKAGGIGTRPVKAFYLTNLNSIDIIADQFGDGVNRTELPESSVRRFRQEEANDRNKKEQDITRKKMKGKQNKPLYNVPKKDVYAWGNDDLMGGTVFYSDMSIPQMGDLSEME